MNTVVRYLRVGVLLAATAGGMSVAQAQSPIQQPPLSSPPSTMAADPATPAAQAAVAQSRAQEREQLRAQREAINAALQQGEAACYQRFAVEDCLKRERRSARQATAPLVQREVALDEAERRERAALRRSDLAERQQSQPLPGLAGPARVRNPDAVLPDVLQQERAYEAQERAQRLQEKQQRHAAELSDQIPQRAAAAEKARQRLEDKRQAAERRRARALEAQQQRAASGRATPAALDPLP